MTQDELDQLKASLLHRLRPSTPLGPDDGEEAFDQHLLLAARIHRAARLNQRGKRDGEGWQQFFESYFPSSRSSRADAEILWSNWRVGLLKDRVPLGRVSITHGHPEQHWKPDAYGALCIDLESMWNDFEYAVDQFTQALATDSRRAAVVKRRWEMRTWTTRPFMLLPQMIGALGRSRVTSLLPVGSVTAGHNSPPKRP